MARYSYIKFTAPTYQQMLLDLVETELSAHPAWEAVDVVNSPAGCHVGFTAAKVASTPLAKTGICW